MNVAIIGCGLIGNKRAKALGQEHALLMAVDTDIKKAQGLASLGAQAKASTDFNDSLKDPRVDIVIVSTTNDMLAEITLWAIKAGKHVLVEKPAGRNYKEIEDVVKLSKEKKVAVKVGFNLRYHPALIKARAIVDSGVMGELMFIRGRYGHGGRVGYAKEWRANPEISGGGELIDQGVHMIDLCRWFLGDFVSVNGETSTYFWDMPVDDNAFLCLSTLKNQIAWVHVSCTEWKNMFSLEIYGKTGKIQIDGLGGSYGMEKLTFYQMLPQMGPPQTTVWEFPGEDNSWDLEFKAFIDAINSKFPLNGDIHDAYEALRIVDKIYSAKNNSLPLVGRVREGGNSEMIIARSPLRITLGGGGTDLPSYYEKHGGFLIAAAIDRYVYITLHETFVDYLIVKYSKMERVKNVKDIKHPIIREALKMLDIECAYLEMSSMADIPAGTGLGSSGSFTTALLKALHAYKRNLVHPKELAQQACEIEINKLGEPIGKQDQYISAYGGITVFEFTKRAVKAYPLKIDKEILYDLEDNLLMFFTGYTRAASGILQDQHHQSKANNKTMIDNLHFIKALGMESKKALEKGDLKEFGGLMNVHWEYKKKRSGSISNAKINAWYDLALKNGALGGKLIGAGGGGFLMFYASDGVKLRRAMTAAGLEEVRFKFDFEGTKVMTQS